MTNNTDPVRALIGEMTEYLDQQVDPELDVIAKWRDRLEAALASAPQPSFDRRFAEMLIGILGDVQDELGFTDEEKLCANGSAEIVAAIRELKERAAAAPPSAPVGMKWAEIVEGLRLADQFFDGDSSYWQWDDGEFFPADKVRIAYQAALAQQPAAPSGAAASAEPAVWVAADTLNSPHPACISSLAYMSQLDRERGREYVPLYTAPQQHAAVDDAMVERATTAYLQSRGTYEGEVPVDRDDMRTALTAALAAQQQGGRADG